MKLTSVALQNTTEKIVKIKITNTLKLVQCIDD